MQLKAKLIKEKFTKKQIRAIFRVLFPQHASLLKEKEYIEWILPYSKNKVDLNEAKKEWIHIDTIDTKEMKSKCTCGARVRYEHTMLNKHNDSRIIVGSSCLDRILNIKYSNIQDIRSGKTVKLTLENIDYLQNIGKLNEPQAEHFRYIRNKRKYDKQEAQKILMSTGII